MLKKILTLALPILFAAVILNATLSVVSSSVPRTVQILPPAPSALKTKFMLGLSNSPSDLSWMTGSGIPWDARYQYLVEGVNTGKGWSTWNSPAGSFAAYYIQDSVSHGYLPVFTYYQLLQSLPAQGSNENDKDYNNLNNNSTMYYYYADFKLLLDQIRNSGQTVIIHIEPDFWGYMQKRSSIPGTIPAAVASTGYPDVAGYANNVAGFAQALVNLRNRYAPKALLAFHVSPWGTPQGDPDVSHDPNFDVQGAAQSLAGFYSGLGASFDLLFYDISDRDAAYYASIGDPNRWWDVNNQTYPNFNRFNQFALALTTLTGKRGIVWQVPLGNTLMCTMNNTNHHWQDNRVQYYVGDLSGQHIRDLANSGIIGLLFGAGDGQQTTNTDAAHDGITNPRSGCYTSNSADDDGGYLRSQAQAFYNFGGVSLKPATPSGLTVTAPGNSQLTLNWTRNSADETGFSIEMSAGGTGNWSEIGTVGAGVTTYTPTGLFNGITYYFRVRSYNKMSYSPGYSNVASGTTTLPAPSSPVISNVQPTSLTVGWTDNSNAEYGFRVEMQIGNSGTWNLLTNAGPNQTSYSVQNLFNGTPYSFRVRAFTPYTTSGFTSPITQTLPFPAPSNLTGTVQSSTRSQLSWQVNSNSQTGFPIERGLSSNGPFSVVATAAPYTTSFNDSSLQPDTTYYYRIRAVNNYSNSPYTAVISLTTPPTEPANLQATAFSSSVVSLTWSYTYTRADGFLLDRRDGLDGSWHALTGTTILSNTTNFTDTGLITGTIYQYRLRAYDGNGQSAYSNWTSAATPGDWVVSDYNSLANAFSQIISGSNVTTRTITFAPGVTSITLSNTLTVPPNVVIAGKCGPNGPAITIVGNGHTLNLSSGVQLYGLTLSGLHIKGVTGSTNPNRFNCVAVKGGS